MIEFKTTDETISGKTLFLIPSYQRGYRWQKDDVQKLLMDLTRFMGTDYCLQPLELQKTFCPSILQRSKYKNFIRVVDGQQRLTTISIIAKKLNIQLDWDIYYLTEERFLSELLLDDCNEKTINAYFRHVADMTIENFPEKESVARFFESKYNIVFPIHFLPDDNCEAEEAAKGQNAFNRLNAGKTPLTSSELIRALYMVDDSGLDAQQRIEISKEWELIENTLANKQFWLMFNAVGLEKTPTRIDLLFALVLNINLYEAKNNLRIVYEELESGYYEKRIDLLKVWESVLCCFWWMQSCYEDIECFNYLGWLAMCTGNQASTIYSDHMKYPTMDDFKKALINRIKENGICEVQMRYGAPRLKDLLLLCNVLECNNNKERLRFDILDSYDIEHIDSRTPNDLSSKDARSEWLKSVYDEYEDLRDGLSREDFCSQEDIEKLICKVANRNKENVINDGDGLGNLVLLNCSINRSYKNAVFPAKRKKIRETLEKGTQYILPCTAKTFMKFYTEDASCMDSWLKVDYEGYQKAMISLIDIFSSSNSEPSDQQAANNDFTLDTESFIKTDEEKSPCSKEAVFLHGEVSFEQIMGAYAIHVPQIQRLYVQGRDDSYGKKCLRDFANVLVDSVCNGTACPLDMIYGIAEGNVFKPLDGQQRLTTLLLLFWLCGKTQKDNGEKWVFDYESRRANEIFIRHLLDTPSPLFKSIDDEKCSDYLAKRPWFMPIWKHDPGIAGMLNMLDSLLEKLQKEKKLSKSLKFDKITFTINYLDVAATEYDHIFLKMNSRGRQLTTWENVKAVIDKYAQNHPDWKQDINLKWPERIWPLVNADITTLDGNMLAVVGEALTYAGYEEKVDDTFQLDKWMESKPEGIEKFFVCAETLFSATEISDDLLLQAMKPCWKQSFLKPNFGMIDEFCKKHLAAYYAAQKSTNADWMRVIWNIMENSNAGSNLPGALKLIDELAEHCNGILEFLASDAKINSDFAREQLKEEREKARLVCDDNSWHDVFREAEAYPFIMGRVSVILEAANRDKLAFSKIVSICAQMLEKREDMIVAFKSYLSYAQDCDLPLWYDKDFYNPEKWKQMFFNDTSKKGVITWLQAEWPKTNAEHRPTQNNWSENLQNHWDDICSDPNEYNGIAKYYHGWGNDKVFLYRTRNIRGAQLISASLRADLVKGLCGTTSDMYHYNEYDQEIKLDNGLKVIHSPDDYVYVYQNNTRLNKIGERQLPVQLTHESLNDFIKDCLEYK